VTVATLAVIWKSAGLVLAADASAVVEVLPPLAWRPTPCSPEFVRGLFAYRGTLIPLVDSARLLGAEPAPDRVSNRVLVLRTAVGPGPSWHVGVWVDAVLDLDRVDFDAAGSHPGFGTEAGRFLGPVARTRWGMVQLVKPDELFTPEQIEVLTQRLNGAAA